MARDASSKSEARNASDTVSELECEFGDVLASLRRHPAAPTPDLAPRILARIRARRIFQRSIAVCLPLAVLSALLVIWDIRYSQTVEIASASDAFAPVKSQRDSDRSPTTSNTAVPLDAQLDRARSWLLRHQDPNGGWSLGRTGASANYAVGTSALALMALMTGHQTDEIRGAILKGLAFLASSQSPDGLFGPQITGSIYNHALACLALLRARGELAVGSDVDRALRRGVDLLVRNQHADGGWSYLRSGASPNSSVTVWALQVLMEAEAAHLGDFRRSIEQGFAWLESTIGPDGRVGYRRDGDHPNGPETLTAAAALCFFERDPHVDERLARMLDHVRRDALDSAKPMDLYRAFFQTALLRAESPNDSELLNLTSRIRAAQVAEGQEAGSWPPLDRWSVAGGRVYSTAMAILALYGR
ncbi:MAG: hypothetical protein NZ740_08600 [Kiritimatiellae bacterium]|nr:hypothetical protein [Kiritimatiellia bacterium]MDW8459152.1 hypothetical protein [Verrucomicrobiota bacterium]